MASNQHPRMYQELLARTRLPLRFGTPRESVRRESPLVFPCSALRSWIAPRSAIKFRSGFDPDHARSVTMELSRIGQNRKIIYCRMLILNNSQTLQLSCQHCGLSGFYPPILIFILHKCICPKNYKITNYRFSSGFSGVLRMTNP